MPNVQPFEIEKLSEHFIPANPALAAREIFIDIRENFLEVREGDKLVAEFPITPGSKTLPAPQGIWKILGIAVLPWFRHDEGVLMHGVRTNDFYNIPPGPNNPVGILWMGLNKPGIGIHGTNNPGDDRPRREPRLHPDGELGCGPDQRPGYGRNEGDDLRRWFGE